MTWFAAQASDFEDYYFFLVGCLNLSLEHQVNLIVMETRLTCD
jgi:hypothetical protein